MDSIKVKELVKLLNKQPQDLHIRIGKNRLKIIEKPQKSNDKENEKRAD